MAIFVYVPKVFFEIDGEGKEVCDGIFHVYYDRKDAEMIHPGIDCWEIQIEEKPHPRDN